MKIQFEERNEAFQDGNRTDETLRILRNITQKIEDGFIIDDINDINGNRIGYWTVEA